jgi:hypothetical protein
MCHLSGKRALVFTFIVKDKQTIKHHRLHHTLKRQPNRVKAHILDDISDVV